jgi:outer membrane protein TolC
MFRHAWTCMAACAVLAGGCAAYYDRYESSADREVASILRSKREAAIDDIQRQAVQPKPPPTPAPAAPDEPTKAAEKPASPPRTLTLPDALHLAAERNRSYKGQAENAYLSALALSRQRRNFGPILSNTLSAVLTDGAVVDATHTGRATIGVSDIIPTGGTLSARTTGTAAQTIETGADDTLSHDVTVSFSQPLLRGFGREVAYESLTQAERDVLYALREFELFRQDFVIDVVRRYYAIVQQKQVVENSRRSYEQFKFLRRRSEALFKISRVTAVDKFRAQQQELEASNDLIAQRETLASRLDEFKVFLNLPTETAIDVADLTPKMQVVELDLGSATDAAVHNRLDVQTSKDRLQDAERKARVARNGLLPDLDLTSSYTLGASRTGGEDFDYLGSYSLGLTLVLPLDKLPERNAYKQAIITLQRRRRAHTETLDNVRVSVANTYRRLRRLGNSVRIQRANVELADRRVANAKLRFEAGELGNRDVVEAQSAQLRARNALIGAILDYEIARLQLKRDIGILFVTPEGAPKE